MEFWRGASRLGGRVCARALIEGLTLLIFAVVAIGAPRDAEAAAYRWKDVNANWNDPNAWDPLDGGTTFPNGPGDEAHFTKVYADKRTATIPNGVIVTVGKIFYSGTAITITGPGRLRIDNGFQTPQLARVAPSPDGSDVISASVELRGSPDIFLPAASGMIFSGTISNNLCACGLTLKVGGRLYLRAPNTYLGTTSVEGGQLLLDFADNVSKIQGNLEIGSGVSGPGHVAEVLVSKHHQISDTSRVLVKAQGLLTIDANELIGETVVTDGFITVRTDSGIFATKSLNMTGGTIESRTNGRLILSGDLTATSSATGQATINRTSGSGVLDLGDAGRSFFINDGPSTAQDLSIDVPIVATGNVGLFKRGAGTLRFREINTYSGSTQVQNGKLWLEPPANLPSIAGELLIGSGPGPAIVEVRKPNAIADTAAVDVGLNSSLWINTTTPEVIGKLTVREGANVLVGNFTAGAKLVTPTLDLIGGNIQMFFDENTLEVTTSLKTFNSAQTAVISGGNLILGGARTLNVQDGPAAIDLRISSNINGGAFAGLKKENSGVASLSGKNTYGGGTVITAGTLLVNGVQPASAIAMIGGKLGGFGETGPISSTAAIVAPGEAPGQSYGRLRSGSISFAANTKFEVELNGESVNDSDRLAVTGTVELLDAELELKLPATLPADASWTIIDNDGKDPVVGTFFGRPEGRELSLGGNRYRLTYRGGDGNDVVIEPLAPPTYYLAEGATGDFFDDDILIANPNSVETPVTMTFLREGGATVVVQRVIPARSRVTIHVDQIEGLEDASASVKVESINYLQLVVERTMFWDLSYYGGHTANAVAKPERQWTFAEGFQGFFDTYLLIANANAAPTTVTLTFLRENDTPVVKTVDVAAFQRKTVYAGDYDELKGRAFGIVVDATEPVIAERAMYFATQPNRLWAGGHVNTGIVAPSRTWFHAEGATGTFFSTFILLSNPQDTKANVEVRFLLADGTVITRQKTLDPKQRLTINPAAEGDTRLENTAVSTVVQSDVPIVSERSMYWEGDVPKALGEGHNSSGVAATGIRWGLAEGRVGGDRNFVTYILLANPTATAAKVRVSYLRENGAPVVKEYDVPATSRFNIDVKVEVPELENSWFGADIEVLNDVPIAVERSLYWDAIGAFWSGGTNALATPLKPAV
jgi:autotransporter-associated beta strand protein